MIFEVPEKVLKKKATALKLLLVTVLVGSDRVAALPYRLVAREKARRAFERARSRAFRLRHPSNF